MHNIIKSFKTKNPHVYVQLFKSYVRPLTEYNNNIWSSHLVSDVKKIESIQQKFSRYLCQKLNIKYDNYYHRLQILKLETLEARQIKSDLILTYKLINNLLDINITEFFNNSTLHQKYQLRRHNQYLKLPNLCKTTIRRHFFSNRIVKIWNKLPSDLVNSKSLEIFKQNIKLIDMSQYADLVI